MKTFIRAYLQSTTRQQQNNPQLIRNIVQKHPVVTEPFENTEKTDGIDA